MADDVTRCFAVCAVNVALLRARGENFCRGNQLLAVAINDRKLVDGMIMEGSCERQEMFFQRRRIYSHYVRIMSWNGNRFEAILGGLKFQ